MHNYEVREACMNFINSGTGYSLFEFELKKASYIDKSMLIDAFYKYAQKVNRYVCVTRPRRFGKSTAANMIAAFFDKSVYEQSKRLFEELSIGQVYDASIKGAATPCCSNCWSCQGKLNVIHINMIDVITEKVSSFQGFIDKLRDLLIEDILTMYPNIIIKDDTSLSEILMKTGDNFAFVLDEWDALFEVKFMTEDDKESYISFLKSLLKDKKYVTFVYMTGILPISKYSSGSPLNMFEEFSAFQDDVLYPYFGLTNNEIIQLIEKQGFKTPALSEMELWYDGYMRSHDGVHVYNPASVSKALGSGVCRNYWTGTGPMNEVRDIILNNVEDVREDIIRMASGESIDIELSGFSVEKTLVNTRDEILSAMVVYGFLTYYEKNLCIPNHELMMKFREALSSKQLGLKQTLEESRKLLEATLEQRDADVASMLEDLHNEKIPFFNYNDENSLACVITMGYISALDRYKITREGKAGKGYADFIFEPFDKSDTAIILELKYNHSAEDAIRCIRERGYIKRLKDYKKVLLVGINYSEKTKTHSCLTTIERND